MRVPLCRCALNEALSVRLHTHPDGESLACCLDGPLFEGQPSQEIGSDLQPVSPRTCTNTRKVESCLPQFHTFVNDFDLDTSVPTEALARLLPPHAPKTAQSPIE